MAPELRSRKPKAVAADEKPTPVKKSAAVKGAKSPKTDSPKIEKRKANEDASPVATKKVRPARAKKVVEELKDEEEVATPVKGTKNKKKAAPVESEDQEMGEAPASVPTPKSALKKQKASPAAPKANGTPVSEKKNKKTTKNSAPAKEAEEEETAPASDDEDDNEEEELDEQTQALVQALEDDEDSETEEAKDKKQKNTYKDGQDVGKIPKQKKASKAAAAAAPAIKGKPGVIYLARIPHGFYEHQIRSYFEQFGPINHIRVARNKKTGASRHRAFIEFAEADTADVAARTMDKYLLFGHLLTAKVVPESQVHANLFKGSNRRFKVVPWNKMQGKQLERPLSESKWAGKITKEEERRSKRAEKLKAIGYEFEAPALKAAEAKEVATIEAEKEETKAIEAHVEEEEKEEVVEEKEVAAEEETKAEETPVKKSPAAKKGSATKATKRSRRSSTKL